MTGRHAGLPVPSDLFVRDQLTAWVEQFESYTADTLDALEMRSGSELTLEQFSLRQHERLVRATGLLCTARQLVAEVLTRE